MSYQARTLIALSEARLGRQLTDKLLGRERETAELKRGATEFHASLGRKVGETIPGGRRLPLPKDIKAQGTRIRAVDAPRSQPWEKEKTRGEYHRAIGLPPEKVDKAVPSFAKPKPRPGLR